MELLDALSEMDENNGDGDNALILSRVCLMLLGRDQRKRLYDSVRREDGTVPSVPVIEALREIMTANQAGKNS